MPRCLRSLKKSVNSDSFFRRIQNSALLVRRAATLNFFLRLSTASFSDPLLVETLALFFGIPIRAVIICSKITKDNK